MYIPHYQQRQFLADSSGVVTSCGCTKVEYDKRPVPPGQSMDLKVIYEAEESGRFTKVVTVYSNAETSPVRLRITGNAK